MHPKCTLCEIDHLLTAFKLDILYEHWVNWTKHVTTAELLIDVFTIAPIS